MFKYLKLKAITIFVLAVSLQKAYPISGQLFFPMTYVNPATLDFVQTFTFTGGATAIWPKFVYKGTGFGRPKGTSSSEHFNVLPYLQTMYRVMPKFVIGFDISNPFFDYIDYKSGPGNQLSTILYSKKYSPKISYQVLSKLTLGIGMDILSIDKFYVTLPFGPPGNTSVNSVKGSKLGWDIGFLYKINPKTSLNGSFHSHFMFTPRGHGTYAGVSSKVGIPVFIPDVYSLNLIHVFANKWLISATARYLIWKIFEQFTITNIPNVPGGKIAFTNNDHNSWNAELFSRYQLASHWAAIGAFLYESNARPANTKSIIYPSAPNWFVGIGGQYIPIPSLEFQLIVGYDWSPCKINNPDEGSSGKSNFSTPAVDFRLSYRI